MNITEKIEPESLNILFHECDWEAKMRNINRTRYYLENSSYYCGVLKKEKLVGFGKLDFDGYIANISDIIVGPDYRLSGIASIIINQLTKVSESKFNSIATLLLDQSEIKGFYEKFTFQNISPSPKLMLKRNIKVSDSFNSSGSPELQ